MNLVNLFPIRADGCASSYNADVFNPPSPASFLRRAKTLAALFGSVTLGLGLVGALLGGACSGLVVALPPVPRGAYRRTSRKSR